MISKDIKLKGFKSLLVFTLILTFILPSTISFAQYEIVEAPLNPEFIRYIENINNPQFKAKQIEPYGRGLIPVPMKIEKDLSFTPWQFEYLNFPIRFDLREMNKVTSVKDQGISNTSWTFAAYGSLESYLLPHGEWDFSENHMKNTHGYDYGHNSGGNRDMSTAYLTRWGGPVLEEEDPFNEGNKVSPKNLPIMKQVKDVLFLPDRVNSLDNDYIKWALMEYGAVQTGVYFNDDYFNQNIKAYYYNDGESSNQAVTIVGWDDNYNKKNFASTPTDNGAFIVKNSKGNNWGEKGYFYVSYYDLNIGKDNAIYINAMDIGRYDNIYQYDPLGSITNIGLERANGGGTNTNWFANVFSSKEYEEFLVATSFYTISENASYEIWIDTDFTAKDFSKLKKVKEGKVEIPGYHTIDFEPKSIESGKTFVVAVKLYTPGKSYSIPVEKPVPGYATNVTANIGESYIRGENGDWFELTTYKDTKGKQLYENTNVNLKAFTKKQNVPVDSIDIEPKELLLNPNQQKALVATISPDNATNKDVIWSAEDPNIARVDKKGIVTAISIGKTNIIARTVDGDKIATFAVEVSKYTVAVGDISFSENKVIVKINRIDQNIEGTVIVQAYDENNRPMKVMYSDTEALKNSYNFDFNNTIKPISYIKVFVWDSLDNMKPLAESK